MKHLFMLLIVILLAMTLVGCFVEPEEEIPEEPVGLPVGEIYNIAIEPENPTVIVGEELILTIHAYDFPDMEEVYIDGERVTWKDNCNEDVLEPLSGLSVVFVGEKAGVNEISACYEWEVPEGCPSPQYLCTGIRITVEPPVE